MYLDVRTEGDECLAPQTFGAFDESVPPGRGPRHTTATHHGPRPQVSCANPRQADARNLVRIMQESGDR